MDGPIPQKYPLQETPTRNYVQRTEWNVRDSDGTLVLSRGELSGGTRLTAELADDYHRPLLIVDLDSPWDTHAVLAWLLSEEIRVLNVAGPREENAPGIHGQAFEFLSELLKMS